MLSREDFAQTATTAFRRTEKKKKIRFNILYQKTKPRGAENFISAITEC